ncbi:MAG TPA: sigma-70 family RNA polymerase sigma factor [Blastocatellia bacterium]|nr:sigma-70 family RNA polymerase sigma factor [Blastocatellia bacterium]
MSPSPGTITRLLVDWRDGDKAALDRLVPLVYRELRRLAGYYMRRQRAHHTLQTSALINEAYLRLIDHKNMRWENRAHFYAVAAQAMRRILVDHARSRGYAKRGGGALKVSFDEAVIGAEERGAELIALDDALQDLAELDPRKSQVVELRYFGGLSVEETAEVIGVSSVTVMREWRSAKGWLLKAITKREQ